MRSSTLGIACGIAGVVLVASCSSSTSPAGSSGATPNVSIANFAFKPTPDTVTANTTVTWTNQDNPTPHTATSDAGSTEVWDTGNLTSNTGSHKFSTVGTFAYHCTVHPSMHGTIVVK